MEDLWIQSKMTEGLLGNLIHVFVKVHTFNKFYYNNRFIVRFLVEQQETESKIV